MRPSEVAFRAGRSAVLAAPNTSWASRTDRLDLTLDKLAKMGDDLNLGVANTSEFPGVPFAQTAQIDKMAYYSGIRRFFGHKCVFGYCLVDKRSF